MFFAMRNSSLSVPKPAFACELPASRTAALKSCWQEMESSCRGARTLPWKHLDPRPAATHADRLALTGPPGAIAAAHAKGQLHIFLLRHAPFRPVKKAILPSDDNEAALVFQ